mmetsp:Transcript_15162/g.49742  ORF Transcript_15162/g.49742 Transcript_15162/m.49742 type:complete len:357 (+) Transcript_15162:1595-2665(+)
MAPAFRFSSEAAPALFALSFPFGAMPPTGIVLDRDNGFDGARTDCILASFEKETALRCPSLLCGKRPLKPSPSHHARIAFVTRGERRSATRDLRASFVSIARSPCRWSGTVSPSIISSCTPAFSSFFLTDLSFSKTSSSVFQRVIESMSFGLAVRFTRLMAGKGFKSAWLPTPRVGDDLPPSEITEMTPRYCRRRSRFQATPLFSSPSAPACSAPFSFASRSALSCCAFASRAFSPSTSLKAPVMRTAWILFLRALPHSERAAPAPEPAAVSAAARESKSFSRSNASASNPSRSSPLRRNDVDGAVAEYGDGAAPPRAPRASLGAPFGGRAWRRAPPANPLPPPTLNEACFRSPSP